MLRLRLQRRGKKNYPTYRVVVADGRAPIKGKFIADVGSYNPHSSTLNVQEDAVKDWISKGVQPTPTVHNLLITKGVITGDKVTSWRPKKKEATAEDASAAKTPEKKLTESSSDQSAQKDKAAPAEKTDSPDTATKDTSAKA